MEIEIIENEEGGYYTVKEKKNGYIVNHVYKSNIENTFEKAILASKEIEIKNNFKNKNKKENKHTCEWCGVTGQQLTVDHIRPLSSFGGLKQVRDNKKLWNEAWQESNLQILCTACNARKGNNTHVKLNVIDFYARKKQYNKIKGRNRKHKCKHKTGYGLSKQLNPELAMQIARSDSNIIRTDIILNNKHNNKVDKLLKMI